MVFRSECEGLFPGAWYRCLTPGRLTQLVDNFHIVQGTVLDTIRRADGFVVAARLKSHDGETLFYTSRTEYEDLLTLHGAMESLAA